MTYHPLRELILARAREFFREPEAIFWVYFFPVLLAVGLGIAFREDPKEKFRVLVEETALPAGSSRAGEVADLLRKHPGLEAEVKPREEAMLALARGKADLVVAIEEATGGGGRRYHYSFDPQRVESKLARARANDVLQEAAGRKDAVPAVDHPVSEPGSRYIDFLIPGLIGMNIMGGGLWGVGFVIVDMRVRKLMKRFLATPMRKRDFMLSVVGSRMIFLVPEIALLLIVGCLAFGVPLRGTFLDLGAIVLVSGLCFSGMGLLVASRAQKIETISGLMNAVMLPMWILSGIFFNAERFPAATQPFIQALPLTSTIDALRAVMLDGMSLASQSRELLNLAVWGLVSYALSLRWFKWA